MWHKQMSLGQGRDFGELAGRLLSACWAAAYCAQIAEEFEVLLVELMQRHHHKAELVLMLWRQRLLPGIGWEGQQASEVLQVLTILVHLAHRPSQTSCCLRG